MACSSCRTARGSLHGTFQHKGDAARELTYLREMLELHAEMFQRKA
jgi:hypothetical protein